MARPSPQAALVTISLQDLRLALPDGGTRAACLALPAAGAVPGPGVVVLHDITGFREDTRRHCRRLAEAGYAALAPDLFAGGAPGCVVSTLASVARGEGPALGVIDAARARLAAEAVVDPARIGITGFCMGGGFALLAAADGAYAVAAPFYGPVPRRRERLAGLCPTIAQFGAQDLAFRGHAARLARHLAALGVPHEIHVLDGVGHSFMNDHPDALFALGRLTPLRARHDAETEATAWARVFAFFAAHGMGVPAPPPG